MACKRVPVDMAKQVAERCEKSQVVILAWDPVQEKTHVTTYGSSADDAEIAAAAGQLLSKAFGRGQDKLVTFGRAPIYLTQQSARN